MVFDNYQLIIGLNWLINTLELLLWIIINYYHYELELLLILISVN